LNELVGDPTGERAWRYVARRAGRPSAGSDPSACTRLLVGLGAFLAVYEFSGATFLDQRTLVGGLSALNAA
jgi:hypothetical protein